LKNNEPMSSTSILEALFLALPSVSHHHASTSKLYALLRQVARQEIENLFSDREAQVREFRPFGALIFPYYEMGAVNSLNLFDLDELIIFSFYWVNRKRYRHVLA